MQLLAYQLGRLKDAGRCGRPRSAWASGRTYAMALDVARSMRSILGGNGISLEHPIFRHMVNLETVYTYEGTHEIHTLVVGADITGLGRLRWLSPLSSVRSRGRPTRWATTTQ